MEHRERAAVSEKNTMVGGGGGVSPDENVAFAPPANAATYEVIRISVTTSPSARIETIGNAAHDYEIEHTDNSKFDTVTSVIARLIGGGVLGAALVAAFSIPIAPVLAGVVGAGVGAILPHFLSQVVIRPSGGAGKPTS